MLARTSGLLLLLLIILNHAVMACDVLVVHLPDHAHTYTSNIADQHTAGTDEQSQKHSNHNEQHTEHAHVSCHIAFFRGLDLLNFCDGAIASPDTNISPISHRPPVPPPNS